MTTAITPRQLDSENPWPGLESFQENAHDYFFGRDQEAESLLNRVRDASVTVLYGRSGLGKTSLLRAGLFPALRAENFLPVYVRLELQQGASALSRQLHQSVWESIRASVPDAQLPRDDETLWEYLHRSGFELWSAQNYPLTPVIVIDQFEELFTLGERVPDLVQDFMNDLGDLAENRIPAQVAARIDHDESEAARFQLRSHNYKLLITLREDFLPHLEEWSRLIPALARSRVRLLPLQADKAYDAVYMPAAQMMSTALAGRVVGIVAGEELHRGRRGADVDNARSNGGRSSGVEPALLSLFCRELNEERKRRGQSEFDEQLVEDAKVDILSNYYQSCVGDLPARVAEFIESELITEKGYRDSFAREDAVPSRISEDELSRLIGSRLLRLEEYHGAQRIELTHDVLTGVVREHRDRRRVDDEKATLAAQAERHQAELEAERESTKRLRKLVVALALVCVAALVLSVVAFRNWKAAEEARDEADAEWLYGNSQMMLAGQSDLINGDVVAIQMALAAHTLRPDDERVFELLSVLDKEPDLQKVLTVATGFDSAAFSPDGRRVASSDGGEIRLWSPATGEQFGTPMRVPTGWINGIAFSPDGQRIVSAGSDSTVRLWDTASGQQVGEPLVGHVGWLSGVAFSPDGRQIASAGSDKSIRLWDAASGRPIGQPLLGHTNYALSVAFSPDGRTVASTGADNTVRLWDAGTQKQVVAPMRHDDWVYDVAFSDDGRRVASGGDDKSVRLWDVRTGLPVGGQLRHDSSVTSIEFSPDGTRLVTGGAGRSIQLWDVATGLDAGVFNGHQSGVATVHFLNDQDVASVGFDGTFRHWDARTWQPVRFQGSAAVAWFSSDGRRIHSGSMSGSVQRWDSATKLPIGNPISIGDSADGGLYPFGESNLLAVQTMADKRSVRVWDADALQPISPPVTLTDGQVAWTDEASRIVGPVAPGVLQVFDARSARPIGAPIKHGDDITAFDITLDGKYITTAGFGDGSVRLWDGNTGEALGSPMGDRSTVLAVATTPDGSRVAVSDADFNLRIWDTRTGRAIGDAMNTQSAAYAVSISSDGSVVAAGADDGSIRLWNTANQQQLGAAYADHEAVVTSLYFDNERKKLISASADNTIRVWPVPPLSANAASDALCKRITNNMASEQWADVVPKDLDYVASCSELPEAEISLQ